MAKTPVPWKDQVCAKTATDGRDGGSGAIFDLPMPQRVEILPSGDDLDDLEPLTPGR
jgi:hypothetical protein